MPKHPIQEFPLIAITECLDMESIDAQCYGHKKVEEILDHKYKELQEYPNYKDWDKNWKQQRPVYIENTYDGPWFRNGHHRLTQAHSLGMLFVHYTNDFSIGWDQDS